MNDTQITPASGFNTDKIIYGKPRDGSIPNSAVTFKRVPMSVRNPDGSVGDLIFETQRLFSFGLAENVNMSTGAVDGYTLSMCLSNMDAPTTEEKAFIDTFNRVCEHAADHALAHAAELGKYELEKADLKKFNPIYLKREKGKVVEGASPVLYAKVLQNKKTNTITSIFYDENGRDIDPMSLMNKQCYVKGAIKIEGIFIGSKVSLQVKLQEAEVKLKETGVKRLMRAPAPPPMPVEAPAPQAKEEIDSDSDSDSDTGSLKDEPVEPVRAPSPPPVTTKAPVRRMGKK